MALLPKEQSPARLYPFLLAIEVAGAVIILWHGLPIYRSLLAKTFVERADDTVVGWAIAGIVLIQAPYWLSTFKVFPSLAVSPHIFAAHALAFLSRLNFVFVSGLFASLVYTRGPEIEFVPWRALMLAAVLFSMFCFSLELERLSRLFLEAERRPR
jgi:hypothetical protein